MKRIQPLDQVSSIVTNALNRTAKVRKSFQTFFIETMILILSTYGKLGFLHLARHGNSCESRFRQNFKKKFDWLRFNISFCEKDADRASAIALDHSFIKKSGKKTPGIAYYWSGCAGTTKRGLEILGFAHITAGVSDARFLFAEQTRDKGKRGRTPDYLKHMKDKKDNQVAKCLKTISSHLQQLHQLSSRLVGDCLFASYNFVEGAKALGFDVISRLRDDAVLYYIYTGPQKSGRGRKKELDGCVDINNLREGVFTTESVEVDGESFAIHSAKLRCKSLKRNINVVIVEFRAGTKTMRKILFSTDMDMAPADIFLLYHARFQIEFLFRDAKQNTGLEDWQSTDTDRLAFGYNASLSAVNVARELAEEIKEQTGRQLSVASVKKVLHNASLYQHIKEFIERLKSDDTNKIHILGNDIPTNILFYGVRDSA